MVGLKRNPKKTKARIKISQIKLSQFNNAVRLIMLLMSIWKICKEFIAKNTSTRIWTWIFLFIRGECHKIRIYL